MATQVAGHREVLAPVSQPDTKVEIGDVWWLPDELVGFPGGKGRFCLVVAVERAAGSNLPLQIHYVAGSTKSCRPPVVILEAGEANLDGRTYFGFWWSNANGLPAVTTVGRFIGRVDSRRLADIKSAISSSKRAALKRLASC